MNRKVLFTLGILLVLIGGFFMMRFPLVFAKGGCCPEYDCSYCEVLPCTGSFCPGDPPIKSQINTQFNEIQNNQSQISSSYEEIENFIEEKGIEDEFKKSEIFENLRVAQNQLSACYNPKKEQSKLDIGKERVTWFELYSCSRFKESLQWQIFYNENYQPISGCYGPNEEEQDLLDNFFCCKSEISPE